GGRRGRQGDSLLDSLLALSDRAMAILTAAEASKSHTVALQAIREARGTLELVGRATGEISAPGQTTVNLALGVSVEKAREAVQLVDEAAMLTDRQVADRAQACLEAYNGANPDDMRMVGPRPLPGRGDGPTP